MTGEIISTGITYGVGRIALNNAFSGTAYMNNIALDSGGNFSAGTGGGAILSGGTDLYNIFGTGGGGDVTRIQPGTNITTGGTANEPTINLSDNVVISSLSATTISGGTIYSGGTDLYSIFSTGGGAPAVETTVNYGTTGTTLTWNLTADSKNAKVILSANTALTVLGVQSGDFGTMEVIQDAVGSRTLSFGAGTNKVVNGGAGVLTLTTNANAIDVISFFYDGSQFLWNVGNDYT